MTTGLVADLGGTNVRFALVGDDGAPTATRRYPSRRAPGMVAAARHYLDETGARPSRAVIAVAGPVTDQAINLTNLGWSFSARDVAAGLGMEHVALINDFEALALSVPRLTDDDLVTVGPEIAPASEARRTVAIVGPGTGLGVGGAVIEEGGRVVPLVTEGGHADFAPADDVDIAVLKFLRGRFGHVSAERLLSGPGLVNLHDALAAIEGRAGETLSPLDITARAKADRSSFAAKVFDRFCAILGSVAGDVALMLGARGGVLMAGGILPATAELLGTSPFRARFEAKGRFEGYMRAIPTRLIVQDGAGLIGAASLLADETHADDRRRQRVLRRSADG